MKKYRKVWYLWLVYFLFITSTAQALVTVEEPGYEASFLVKGLANPQDIAFPPGGEYGLNLFVTEYGINKVTKITPAGTRIPLPGEVIYPVAILFGIGSFGNYLYVSESYVDRGNIVKLFPDGRKETFVTGIVSPLDMVLGSGDFGEYLYVTSANADKIVKVSPSGEVSDFVTSLVDRPSVLAFSPPSSDFGNYYM